LERINCDSVLEQLSDYLDADSRSELCRAIEEHMSRCKDCRVYVDSIKKMIVLYQAGSPKEISFRAIPQLQAALAGEYKRTGTR
jgi:predicted anti-sigma-YlaC factor YlaD